MEDFPYGYEWTCCKGRYDAKPCQVGTHTWDLNEGGNGGPVSRPKRQRDDDEHEARKERRL